MRWAAAGATNLTTGNYLLASAATATSSAISDGTADADSSASGNQALATSQATGANGHAASSSDSATPGLTGHAYAYASVGSSSSTESFTSATGQFRAAGSGLEAYSYLSLNPTDTDVINRLSGNSALESSFSIDPTGGTVGTEILGLGQFGFGFPADGIESHSHSITQSFDLNPTLYGGRTVLLGLLDGEAAGNGFEQLDVTIDAYGLTGYSNSWSFTDATSALSFFSDNPLNLGIHNGNYGSLSVSVNWYSSNLGDRFSGGLVSGMSAVPESSSIVIMLFLCVGILVLLRRNPQLFGRSHKGSGQIA